MGFLVTRSSLTPPPSEDRLAGDEWFASDMSTSGDGPLYGFEGQTNPGEGGYESGFITFSYFSSGGPANRPFVREVINVPPASSEFGHVWAWTADGAAHVGWGGKRIIRFSFRFASGEGNQEQKVVQFNRGDLDNDRFVLTFEDIDVDESIVVMQRNGGEDSTPYPAGGVTSMGVGDQWFDVQIELQYSSAEDVADGYWKIWVNNDTYASPSRQQLSIVLNTSDDIGSPDWLSWCGIHQVITGSRTLDHSDVRVGPTFWSNWHASGAGA